MRKTPLLLVKLVMGLSQRFLLNLTQNQHLIQNKLFRSLKLQIYPHFIHQTKTSTYQLMPLITPSTTLPMHYLLICWDIHLMDLTILPHLPLNNSTTPLTVLYMDTLNNPHHHNANCTIPTLTTGTSTLNPIMNKRKQTDSMTIYIEYVPNSSRCTYKTKSWYSN